VDSAASSNRANTGELRWALVLYWIKLRGWKTLIMRISAMHASGVFINLDRGKIRASLDEYPDITFVYFLLENVIEIYLHIS